MKNNDIFESTYYKKIKGHKINFLSKKEDSIYIFKDKPYSVNKKPIIIFSLAFILGISLMFYPMICNLINRSTYHYIINNYDDEVENTSSVDKEKMLEDAVYYNSKLNNSSIKDVFSTDDVSHDSVYETLLNITDDGLMGYIDIPKINVKLPIYHGTVNDVLNKGVGHLKGSSLPVGGVGTHSILAAHRGLPSSKLFSDLDKVNIGDKFYISILDKKLVYQVDNVVIVKPSEFDLLEIDKNKDYITLVTCTPYGVNSHRLLVRGIRIEEDEQKVINELENKKLFYLSDDDKLLIGLVLIILVLVIFLFGRMLVKRDE